MKTIHYGIEIRDENIDGNIKSFTAFADRLDRDADKKEADGKPDVAAGLRAVVAKLRAEVKAMQRKQARA